MSQSRDGGDASQSRDGGDASQSRDGGDASQSRDEVYDVVGVGLGPFNLGLAALLDDVDHVQGLFLEQKSAFEWHGGMLIEGTTLEVPFLADLVTLADPTSRYSYLNYLRERDRIYEFYFYETFAVPRREYDAYCRWVSEEVDACRFSRRVTAVRASDGPGNFVVEACDPETGTTHEYHTRHLVLGVGSQPHVPDSLHVDAPDVFHTANYLDRRERCLAADSVTVVGSGQSAAEVFLDLLNHQPEAEYRLDWLTRSDGFFPMEYSKLGLQHFTPEYTRYFYGLDQEQKDEIRAEQDLLYKGIDMDTSAAIYDLLYERSIEEDPAVGLFAMTDVRDIEPAGSRFRLSCEQWQAGEEFVHESDVVVLGTGYHRPDPPFLAPIEDAIGRGPKGRFRVSDDYRLAYDGAGHVFVQNADLHTHGVGAPDLGLGCYRNAVIIEALADREVYPVDSDTVFQDFEVAQFVDRSPHTTLPDATPLQND